MIQLGTGSMSRHPSVKVDEISHCNNNTRKLTLVQQIYYDFPRAKASTILDNGVQNRFPPTAFQRSGEHIRWRIQFFCGGPKTQVLEFCIVFSRET